MRINQELNDKFITISDLALAGVINLYFPLQSIEKTDSKRVNFVFAKNPEIEALVDKYWKKELSCNPQEYFSSIKFLKSRLWSL